MKGSFCWLGVSWALESWLLDKEMPWMRVEKIQGISKRNREIARKVTTFSPGSLLQAFITGKVRLNLPTKIEDARI